MRERQSMNRTLRTSVVASIGVLLAFLFSTCEISVGLGAKVDVNRPVVSITGPSSGSFLRSPITVTGTASDDISLKTVTVSWVTGDSRSVAGVPVAGGSRVADVSGENWQLTISEADIPDDGSWVFTATATDNANKTASASVSLTIDNKPPTVLATSPLTYTFADGRDRYRPVFYRNIDLKGEVYDPSTLESVEVSILNAAGDVLVGPTVADGTNTWSIRFELDELGILTNGDRYYYRIKATDLAGNESTYFHHRYDIYPLLDATTGYVSFPSMNNLGLLDQGMLTSLDAGLTAAELEAVRHGPSAVATADLEPDFTFLTEEANKVQWLNITDANSVIGLDVPVVGTILPASDGSAINLDEVFFAISPLDDPANIFEQLSANITLTQVGESVNFELVPTNAAGSPLTSGNYLVELSYRTNANISVSETREFGVSSGVPHITETLVGGVDNPLMVQRIINSATTIGGICETSDGSAALVPTYTLDDVQMESAGVESGSERSWSLVVPAPADGSNDGTHTYTLSANDGGMSSSLSRVFVVDTTSPVVTVLNPTVGLAMDNSGGSLSFNGTADDGAGSGIRAIHYQVANTGVDLSAADWTEWPLATGTISWSGSFDADGLAEGGMNLWLVAVDAAGNETRESVAFSYDQSAPSIAETLVNTDAVQTTNMATAFGGTASDSNALSTVTVSVNGAAPVAVSDTNGDGNTATLFDTWAYTLPNTDEGNFSLVFTATDTANRTTTVTRNVFVDIEAPAAPTVNVVSFPATYVSGSLTLDGTVADTGLEQSGIASVSYRIAPQAGGPDQLTGTMTGTETWFRTIDVSTLSPEGGYTIHLRATDRAGNVSLESERDFDVDSAAPAIQDLELDGTALAASVRYVNADFAISFDAYDSNSLASYTITRNGSNVTGHTAVALTGTDPTAISLNEVLGSGAGKLEDGEYQYVISLVDAVGRTTSVTRTVFVDTSSPTLTVTSPASGEGVEMESYTMRGTVEDGDGRGVTSLEYSLDSTNGVDGAWTAITRAFSWSVSGLDFSSGGEGPRTLWVRASDGINPATVQEVNFFYDVAAPTFEETTVNSASTQNLRTDLVFGGTVIDSNASGNLTVEVSVNGAAATAVGTTYTANGTPQAWSYTFDADTPVAEVLYTLVFTARDAANKTTSVTRSVRVDRTAPSLTNITDLASAWQTSAAIAVSGKVSDGGSGVASAQYATSSDGGSTWSAWQNFAISGTAASGTVAFVEGTANRLRVRATDLAGNATVDDAQIQTVRVDTLAPSLTAITNPTNTPLVNGTAALTIALTASDDGSGLASAQVSTTTAFDPADIVASTTTFTAGAASLSVPAANIAALGAAGASTNTRLYVRVLDATNRASGSSTVNLVVDRKVPTGSVISHGDEEEVNKLIVLSGTATDENGLGSLGTSFQVWKADTSVWVVDADVTIDGTPANWTISNFNTATYTSSTWDRYAGTAGVQLLVRYGAIDAAGNTGYIEHTLLADQNADRPTVNLANILANGTATLKGTRTVYGSIRDDDGSVLAANFAVGELIGGPGTMNWQVANAGGSRLTYNVGSGSFTYEPSSGDGTKTLYFRITDAATGAFETAETFDAGDILVYPLVSDGTTDIDTFVSFKIDTNPPTIGSSILYDLDAPADFADAGSGVLVSNMVFGGDSSSMAQRLDLSDAVGIASITRSFNGGGTTLTVPTSGTALSGTWDFAHLDLSVLASGTYDLVFTAVDESGLSSVSTRQIIIDHNEPDVAITSHTLSEQVTGDVTLRGTAEDPSGGSGLATVEYCVGRGLTEGGASVTGWAPVSNGTFSWNILFTNITPNHDTAPPSGTNTLANWANSDYATEIGSSNVWSLPIHIRALDALGNERVTTHILNVDPDGDRPVATISYPDDGATLGSTIRVFGSATDNVSVSQVYMMIDTDNDGDYDADDVAWLQAEGYTISSADEGFQVSGTASWSQLLNENGEFNPSTGDTNTIRIKVRAIDNNGLVGNWSLDRTLNIDNNVPRIGDPDTLRLVQYDGSNNIIAERSYQSDMYIRGEWFLVGSIADESGITDITVYDTSTNVPVADLSGGPNADWFVSTAVPGGATNIAAPYYQLRIPLGYPVGTAVAGNYSYRIEVTDDSDPVGVTRQTVSVNYDNIAPVPQAITHGGLPVSDTNLVTQSNNTYSMASSAEEAHSGFERLAFFFVRRGDAGATPATVDRVYNPLLAPASARTNLSSLSYTAGDLPRRTLTGVTRDTEDSLEHADVSSDPNIRAGGVVRIAGVDRRIQSVTGDVVTFTPSVSTIYTEAAFAYAQVVDNTIVETGNWSGGPNPAITNDDGDGMVEGVERMGTTYNWNASINSLNIPDGPIELHYVVYDKAGNAVAGSVNTFVSNNRPLLAKVLLATDLTGDDAFASSEITTFYSALSGEEEYLVNLASASYRMKGNLAVLPEFVGGNGSLAYTWAYNGTETAAWDGTTLPDSSISGTVNSFTTVTTTDASPTVYDPAIVFDAGDFATMDDIQKLFSFCFWDETEETTQGSTSQWARLNVPLIVDVVDSVNPVAVIDPFYWNSESDNSLYGNSRAKGHIEIDTDLPTDTFDEATGVFDLDPKVSGQVSIRGSAYDDTRLGEIWAFIGDGTTSTFTFTGATTSSTQFDTDGNGTPETLSRTYTRLAHFDTNSGLWVKDATTTVDTQGWVITVSPDYLDQTGHRVNWQLDWDSADITGVADTDLTVRVIATDSRPNASSETENGTVDVETNNVPAYQMDVVPYVTEVETGLSSLKSNNPSVYNRTALGRYPVNEDEDILLHGFNLAGATIAAATGESDDGAIVTVPMTGLSSGALVLTVNTVPLLNNSNSETAEYNLLPNGDNNLNLNDDVLLDVWEFNSRAAIPSRGIITDPVMKIHPTNKIMGFAFVNGPDYFSMSNGATNSYTLWQRNYDDFGLVSMAYDSTGRSHGMVVGRDINSGSNDGGRFVYLTSRWGQSEYGDQSGNYGGVQSVRLESIGVPAGTIVNGTATATAILDKSRIRSPSIAVAGADRVYLAYYDDVQQQIRFRYGTNSYNSKVNLPNRAAGEAATGNGGNFGQFADQRDINNTYSGWNTVFESRAANYSLVADAAGTTPNNPGEYLSLGVIPGANAAADVVVLVWFDYQNQKLMFSSKLAPQNDNDASETTGSGMWSTAIEIFDGAGEYCQLAIDNNNGIHIVANDLTGADLRYAYLSSYTATDPVTCVVDSYGIVGTNMTIDTVMVGTKAVPYIGYYMASTQMPKLAVLVDTTSFAPAGVVNDVYTGAWEISMVPTVSRITQDRINVGVWKDPITGFWVNSKDGTQVSTANTTSGTCYGNGTQNPALVYAIKEGTSGYLESAQKR